MIDTEALRKKVIDLAIQGKLTEQLPEDGNAESLYAQIQEEKTKLIKEGKIKKEKPLIPISESEIPFEVPRNWKWVRIGDVTYNHGQKTPEDTFCYIDVGTLDNVHHKLNEMENIVEVNDAPSRAKKIVVFGDVLYSTVRPYLHNICVVDKSFSYEPIASTAFAVMHTFEEMIINKYLFFWLLSEWFDKYANGDSSKGTLYPAIGEKDFYNGLVPMPPYEEQKRIVEIIERTVSISSEIDTLHQQYESDLSVLKSKIIDAGIRGKLTEQLPEDGDAETLYSQIQEEKATLIKEGKIKKEKPLPEISADEIPFEIPKNWKWVRLQCLVSILGDGLHGTPQYDEKGEYFFVNGNNFCDSRIVIKPTTRKINEYEYQKYKKELNENTVFISINGTLGNIAFYNNEKIILGKSACYFNLLYKDLKEYIYYTLKSDYYLKYANYTATGVTIKNVSLKAMNEFCIPLPPMEEQKRIARKIRELLEIIS